MLKCKDVKELFQDHYKNGTGISSGTVEEVSLQFEADQPYIFRKPNQEYIDAEIQWYNTEDRSVDTLAGIYGKRVAIWDSVADKNNIINSNYGWCIYSKENGNQFNNVLLTLMKNPESRQAVMIYNRPTMHLDATENGRSDFMCTHSVHYMIRDGKLISMVYMRSNDLVFGYNNDYAWQRSVQESLAKQLEVDVGRMVWHVGSAHVYERHFGLLKG